MMLWLGWISMVAMMATSSAVCVRLALRAPWSDAAHRTQVPLMFGLALSPFLLGALAILALGVLPGARHGLHVSLMASALIALTLWLWRSQPRRLEATRVTAPFSLSEKAILWVLLLFAVGLLANTLALPLLQNDALEYATVGRILFESRDLTSYPAIHPEATASGFYGPWTHPPLYVALIYLSNLLQGHADAPGLMRLISPWCALLATGVVYSLGGLINRRTGLLAALLFLSTPLFYLGADSALIDALPVLAAALVFATLVGLEGRGRSAVLWQGIALGLALWTHSSAVLLVPLAAVAIALQHGLRGWRPALIHILCAFIVACVLAAWPYLRNLTIFGSLISDNPVIFALPELGWKDYFAYNRGINSTAALIQYGLFKGWSALESYGAIFWVMAIGLVACLRQFDGRGITANLWQGLVRTATEQRLLWLGAMVVLTYHGGVVLSILLGIDLMIRNERYMLMILPFVAILAAWVIDHLIRRWQLNGRVVNAMASLILGGAALMLVLQLALFVGGRLAQSGITATQEATLMQHDEYRAMDHLRTQTPASAVILSMRPADMYYAHRRMISYLDPQLVPFYAATSHKAAHGILRSLGVTHVAIPGYSLPPLYNSALMELLADPAYSGLVFQSGGYRIFALDVGAGPAGATQRLHTQGGWTRQVNWMVGGRKALARIRLARTPFDIAQPSVSMVPGGWFQRDFSTQLISPLLPLAADGIQEYRLNAQLRGHGFVAVSLQRHGCTDAPLPAITLGERVLDTTATPATLQLRFRLAQQTCPLQIVAEHFGNSQLVVDRITLQSLAPAKP